LCAWFDFRFSLSLLRSNERVGFWFGHDFLRFLFFFLSFHFLSGAILLLRLLWRLLMLLLLLLLLLLLDAGI